ncbi:MAG: amino acid adenylation domain-containing protein, partial [Cyanobacteria bacterium J06632_22]
RHLSQMMPLFQVKLDLQQANVKPLQLDGLTIERYPLAETQAKYELRFNLQETDQGITGQVEYNCDLFDPSTIERMVGHFQILLAGIVVNPQQSIAQLPLLSQAEQQTLLVDWNQTQRDYPTHFCIHELFEAQAQETPDAPALTDGQRALSYRTLNQAANRLAHHLRELGVGAETRVGVCLPRTASLVVSLLAILKAGGTYVPLDPAYPSERLAFIVEDADIAILLAQDISPDVLASGVVKVVDPQQIPDTEQTSNLEKLATSNTLAYVIYTSGSTGRPKGVAIEHRSTVAMLHWARSEFSLEDLYGVLAATSVCFDLSVFEIFVPLSWGGRVVLVENALALRDLSESANVRLVNTVPSVLNQLLKVGQLPASVRTVNLAGEALPATLVQKLQQTPQVQKIYNLYGPSEDTTYSTCAPLHEAAATGQIPIGSPIANTQAYVLDHQQQPVPVGVVGELYLGGSGLARGYLNRPELTANVFSSVVLPLINGQQRLYRTGDRVRYRADGQLEFLGRFDHQVKIRGFRIEIGEVEAVLRQQPAVQDVIVVAHGETDQQLVAYVVLNVVENNLQEQTRDRAKDPVNELRHALSQQLPAYLVPTLWVTLDALPQLPNGKINRRALPLPQVNTAADYVAPRSPLETTLAEIWGDVLHRERVSIHDNFFELGGHSLLAIQIIAQAEFALGCKIPLRTLFQAPTIAGFALQVTEQVATQPENSRLEVATPTNSLPQLVVDVDQRHAPFPLTDIQQAYWLGRAKAFELGNIGTHGYREIEVTGLAVAQIEQVLNRLIERHDMLRAVVNPDGQQQILTEVPHYTIPFTDLRSNTAVHIAQALAQLRDRLSHQVFSPDQWPLFQIEAAQLSDNRVRFYVSFDVLIGDAWSFQLLGKEMAQLLRGDALQPLAVSFRDYVVAEQAFRHTPAYQQALGYWQDRLPTLPPAPDLPLTQSLSQITAPQFERRSGQLAAAQWQQLKQRAYRANLTPSGVMLAAFAEVLSTWSRQPQFTLNLTLFNRQPLHPDVNRLVGDFTASLLLAIDSQETDSFTTRAQRLQTQLWNDLDHRAVSGVQVLRDLARQQNRSPGALMPVVFTSTLNQPIPASEQAAWQSETVYSVSQTSQVYLDHQMSEIAGALVFNWDAIADLFPAGMLDQMFSAYEQLLHQLAETDAAWQTYPQLAPTDHVAAFNQTGAAVQKTGELLLHSLFWQQVEKQPDTPAVITPERTLTYQTLAQQVQVLAQQLRPMVQPNQLVAVSIPKGWQQVVAVLGILTAGAAYVPIDPDLPQERRWQLMADTAAQAVVTTAATPDWPNGAIQILLNEQLQTPDDDVSLPQPVQSETDLAYVIYTSGSTGTPKGVMIDHRGAVNTILDINQRFEVGNCDLIFALSSLSFDLSVYDIFGTLAAGAAIVMPAANQVKNTAHWRNLLVQHQVTVWNSVPALMGLLLSELSVSGNSSEILDSSLRLAMLSGDWIPLTLPEQFKQQFSDAQLISLGGATEASIWSIAYPIETVDPSWHSIPYGRPLAHQQWYVLDENLHPCPPWVTGQLHIGGVGLAQGYWNRPELTTERFITNPLNQASTALDKDIHGGKLYKTGDLGRYLPHGTLEFLGREDFQVKVNGYRVELGEIESALQQYPAISSAVVDAV